MLFSIFFGIMLTSIECLSVGDTSKNASTVQEVMCFFGHVLQIAFSVI